ncbi:hypothetical protein B0H13DRAFT_1612892, partial [Mycena leptocephala]
YIHHLKENEARNIEKWTLEKLLMEEATSEFQVQLDEIRSMWEEERMNRQRAKQELEVLRGDMAVSCSSEKRSGPDDGHGEGGDDEQGGTNIRIPSVGVDGGVIFPN